MPGYLDVNHLNEDWQAPDNEVQAQVASGVASAASDNARRQAESAQFCNEYGAAVVGGHAGVRQASD